MRHTDELRCSSVVLQPAMWHGCRLKLFCGAGLRSYKCAVVLCDMSWLDPDMEVANGIAATEQSDMLRLDAMILMVQLNIRKLVEVGVGFDLGGCAVECNATRRIWPIQLCSPAPCAGAEHTYRVLRELICCQPCISSLQTTCGVSRS
jgi:hypothetical protein